MSNNTVVITASGLVGSGKSALLGIIEDRLKELDVSVVFADEFAGRYERDICSGNWVGELAIYKPQVTLIEANVTVQSAVTADDRLKSIVEFNKDLGLLKWMGADDGWDCAVRAIQNELSKLLGVQVTKPVSEIVKEERAKIEDLKLDL